MEVPVWASIVVGLGTGLGAAVLTLIGAYLTERRLRHTADQADKRAHSNEVGVTYRWAAELAMSADPRTAFLGVRQLRTLYRDTTIQGEDRALIESALDAVVAPADGAPAANRRLTVLPSTGGMMDAGQGGESQ